MRSNITRAIIIFLHVEEWPLIGRHDTRSESCGVERSVLILQLICFFMVIIDANPLLELIIMSRKTHFNFQFNQSTWRFCITHLKFPNNSSLLSYYSLSYSFSPLPILSSPNFCTLSKFWCHIWVSEICFFAPPQ